MLDHEFTSLCYSPSQKRYLTSIELIDNIVSDKTLLINPIIGEQDVLAIGANPNTFLWPDGHRNSVEPLVDIIGSYQAALEYSPYSTKFKKYGTKLESTRENVVRSLSEQGIRIGQLEQVNLFGYRTKNDQLLKVVIDSASDDEINDMINDTLSAIESGIKRSDLIFLGWGAALGDNILTKPRFEKYREKLYELLEPHFDRVMCMKLSETMQPYHPSSSAYRVVPLSTLIHRDQFAEMFHLN